jgi:aminopeptidase N
MKKVGLSILFISFLTLANAQALFEGGTAFTRADSLRGTLTPLRTCYDVVFYDLYVDVNHKDQSLIGNNTIVFKTMADFEQLQVDLSSKLEIDSIVYNKKQLKYTREFNAVFIKFPATVKKGGVERIKIYYHGFPTVAKMAPWDGGLVFSVDKDGKPWLAVACEGIGASAWWPCKDHLSDEPDSMAISGPAPKGLQFISNGRLRKSYNLKDGREVNSWFVSYPINSYNATYYIGNYENFSDTYTSPTGKKLDLDYYVMPYNIDKARKQFEEVKPMMKCFEQYFGPYPFWKDGYKLVESPYLGMEHQSAIAYGNDYKNGYAGIDFSGYGLQYDFIIIHESGHEWWGNNITMADMADMWISEGFCTYSEVVYVECRYGPKDALKYINYKKKSVENDRPVIGAYGVNNEGSGDMYNKGALMIHTLRAVINNDKLFFDILLGLQKDFSLKQVTTDDIVNYYNTKTGLNLTPIFNQYLKYTAIPAFEYTLKTSGDKTQFMYRWKADVKDFAMPVDVFVAYGGKEAPRRITPTTDWQTMVLMGEGIAPTIKVDTDHYYIKVSKPE